MLNTLVVWLKLHVRSERGQDLIEYALLGGLIAGALLAVAVLTGLTTAVTDMANGVGDCIDFDSATACNA